MPSRRLWKWSLRIILFHAAAIPAAELIPLVQFDTIWKYDFKAGSRGQEWTQPSYDDSQWRSGPGVLGYPTNANLRNLATIGTPFSREELVAAHRSPVFFRTTFSWTNEPANVVLISSNFFDDGAVLYLNGKDVGRLNASGANRAVSTTILDVGREGYRQVIFPPGILVEGDNVLAAELHQNPNPESPQRQDAIFGMCLWARVHNTGPPIFLQQPTNQLYVTTGELLSLQARGAGQPPLSLQWMKDGSPLPDVIQSELVLPKVALADSGIYALRISNALGVALSSNCLVQVEEPGLVPFSQLWRYHAPEKDLGRDWKDSEFNDAFWKSGPGPIGFHWGFGSWDAEKLLGTRLQFPEGITYYFRTEFDWPGAETRLELQLGSFFDDGGVLYLNGAEIYRVGMPLAEVDYATLANRGVRTPFREDISVPNVPLRHGRNVLAAELHAVAFEAADIVFGLRVAPNPPPPTRLEIVAQPTRQTVEEGRSVTLQARVRGANPHLQWFFNGSPIPDAMSLELALTNTTLRQSGSYFLQLSNALGVLKSEPVTVLVTPDTNAPILLEADAREAPDQVRMVFSEPIALHTATNISHYQVTNTLGETVPVLAAKVLNSTSVVLTLTAQAAPSSIANRILNVHGIRDASPQSNLIAQDSAVPVAMRRAILGLDQRWRFRVAPTNSDASWTRPEFDSASWQEGQGIFVQTPENFALPANRGASLDSNGVAFQFRASFVSPHDSDGGSLLLRHFVDDGAVFFLNGQEFHRFNVSSGPALPAIRARSRVQTAALSDPVVAPAALLRPGTNLLAVQLHRARSPDYDAAFACQLELESRSIAEGSITITRHPADQHAIATRPFTLTADAVGAAGWQWFRNGGAVPGATNRVWRIQSVPLDWDQSVVHAVATATDPNTKVPTRDAKLIVTADPNPPRILAAQGRDRAVEIIFDSSPLAAAALLPEHYSITNKSGQSRRIQSLTVTNRSLYLVTDTAVQPGDVLSVTGLTGPTGTPSPTPILLRIGFDGIALPFDTVWKFNQATQGPSPDWHMPEFDDASWSSGPGLLGEESATLEFPLKTAVRAPASGGPMTTYYRTAFDLAADGPLPSLLLRHFVDDGAVFYINGREAHRVRVLPGQGHASAATRQVPDTAVEGPFEIPATHLRPGRNVLAAEVHQFNPINQDVVFGAELSAPATPSVLLTP